MSNSVKLRGSEPDDVVPSDWYAYFAPRDMEVIFCVHYYMEAPAIDDYQSEAVLDAAAGLLCVSLRDLIDAYVKDCVDEDYGDGLIPLADLFTEYAAKLRNRKNEVAEEVLEQKKYDSKIKLVIPEGSKPDLELESAQTNHDDSITAKIEFWRLIQESAGVAISALKADQQSGLECQTAHDLALSNLTFHLSEQVIVAQSQEIGNAPDSNCTSSSNNNVSPQVLTNC